LADIESKRAVVAAKLLERLGRNIDQLIGANTAESIHAATEVLHYNARQFHEIITSLKGIADATD
jgi:ABC-type transporter Mla subunit MlaD